MQGLWKDKLKYYRKDKKRVINRFNPHKDEKLDFYYPDKRLVYSYKEYNYGKTVSVFSFKYNNKKFYFYKDDRQYYSLYKEFFSNELLLKYLKITSEELNFIINNSKIEETKYKYKYNKIITTVYDYNFINKIKVFLYNKPLPNYLFDRFFKKSGKFCKKYSNKIKRRVDKEYNKKLLKDINIYNNNYPKDFIFQKSISHCIS